MTDTPYVIDYSQRLDNTKHTDNLFIHRWSPRSFKKVSISEEDRAAIFNAARFAPSAYNAQPWRIFASTDKSFDTFLSLLNEFNQSWAKNASIIGFTIAKTTFDNNKENNWAQYDCGFAWASLTFQARKLGYYTHGMAGIKIEEIYKTFEIPKDTYKVIAGFAIGILDVKEKLSEELQEKEKPSGRKLLNEIYFPDGGTL